MTDNERNMSRDEEITNLRVNCVNALMKCMKLEKEVNEKDQQIKDLQAANWRQSDDIVELHKQNKLLDKENSTLKHMNHEYLTSLDALRDEYNELNDKYRELKMSHEACESVWLKCEERNDELKGTLEAKNEEIERLHEKVSNQKTQLVEVQQALTDRNLQIEALNGENDRLKKEVKERRVVFEPTSYQLDIQAKDEAIKALRKKNLDLKNENEGWKLKYDQSFDKKNREITALKDEIEALKDALHDDEVEIHKLKEERNDYSDDIDGYEEIVTELRAKVKRLEGDISSANKRVEAYKNDYYRILNAYNDQKDIVKKLEAENAVQKAQISIDNLYIAYYANEPDEEKEDE